MMTRHCTRVCIAVAATWGVVLMMLTASLVATPVTAAINNNNNPRRHDGKGHGRHHRLLDTRDIRWAHEPRQHSPVEGLGSLQDEQSGTTTTTTSLSSSSSSSSTAMSTSTASSTLALTISSYSFPTTVVQVPVATLCPDTPASSALFANFSTNTATNNTTSQNVSVYATALLPNGDSTVFWTTTSVAAGSTTTTSSSSPSSSSSSSSSAVAGDDDAADAAARIIFNPNGCQTVYSAHTTTLCSTTLRPFGLLPVSITDCGQWVTFSTKDTANTLEECSTAVDGATTRSSVSSTATATPTALASPTTSYIAYAAHWYDLLQNVIPNLVQVQNCWTACQTSTESWSVTTTTSTTTGTSVASFEGVSDNNFY